jgi:cytochrome c-type protein NapC
MSRSKHAIGNFFRGLGAWCRKPGTIVILVAGLFVGGIGAGGLASFMVYANSESFCAGACHEMGQLKKEYTGSIHDMNRSGVQATCNDCHLPHAYVTNYLAKLGLLSDVWGHWTGSIDTPAKFDAKRPELARRVWAYMKANDSRECRHCHTTAKMDKEKQTKEAISSHLKGRKMGQTCIDCHYAISHKEPAGPGPQEMTAQGAH